MALGNTLTGLIAGVAGDAAIHRCRPRFAGLGEVPDDGDLRGDKPFPQVLCELPHVIGLVGAQRDAAAARPAIQHRKRRLAFGRAADQVTPLSTARSCGSPSGHDRCSRPGRLALTLFVEPCLGIGGVGMDLAGTLSLVEVALGIPPGSLGSSFPSLRQKLLIDAHGTVTLTWRGRWLADSDC